MKKFKFLPLLLCIAIVGSATAQEKTKELLTAAGVAHVELDGGVFKVAVTNDAGTTNMLVTENAILGNTNEHLQIIQVYSQVVAAPEGFNPPAVMYKKLDELNGNSTVGRLFTMDGSIWMTSEQSLRLADATSFAVQLELMAILSAGYEEILAPFVEEE